MVSICTQNTVEHTAGVLQQVKKTIIHLTVYRVNEVFAISIQSVTEKTPTVLFPKVAVSPVHLGFSETHVSSVGCMCIPLLFSLSFYSILVGKCVFNIVNQRLCFHATSTTGNSAPTNNKKRLSDFNWKGVQDKCSVPPQGCEDVGAGQLCPLGRAVAVWKIQSSPRVGSSWDGYLGQLALWQCFMKTWRCQPHIAEGH